MTPRDYSHEHTTYCEGVNVLPMRKAVPAAMCPTCKAWWDGYARALTPIVDDGDDDE